MARDTIAGQIRPSVADNWVDVKTSGRAKGAKAVTITKNEILTGLNKPDEFILTIVEVEGGIAIPRYVREPFKREPDFGVTSVNYDLPELLNRGEEPN